MDTEKTFEGLILMDVSYEGPDRQVDEYSRTRAANALAATVQKGMAKAESAIGAAKGDGSAGKDWALGDLMN